MHRIGGIEKQIGTGNLDYGPANHQAMTDIRKAKVDGIADHVPEQDVCLGDTSGRLRSEEHTSELQSLMRISYAVFCLKKKKIHKINKITDEQTIQRATKINKDTTDKKTQKHTRHKKRQHTI